MKLIKFFKQHLTLFIFIGIDITLFILLSINNAEKYMTEDALLTTLAVITIIAIINLIIFLSYKISKYVTRKNNFKDIGYRHYLISRLNGSDNIVNDSGETNIVYNIQYENGHTDSQKVVCDLQPGKDIIALMLKNNDEITEYFQISKSQSRCSFWVSAIACIAGIVILGITVYSVFALKQSDVAIVGVISGAITELFAGTIFWLHNKSALQLNHYYDALHENEKVLLAINLMNTLSQKERENMCKEIIRTQIYKQKNI